MKYVLRALFTSTILAVLGFGVIALLKYLHPSWWKRRAVRVVAWGLPAVAIGSGVLWMVGFRLGLRWVFTVGSTLSAVALVLLFALILTLPLSGLLHLAHRALEARARRKAARDAESLASSETVSLPEGGAEPLADPGRRELLKVASFAAPIGAALTSSSGISRAFRETRVYLRPMRFPDLPRSLQGLRILHVTDSHLGFFRFLDDLQALFQAARPFRPDLVLLTGDISDDLELLPGALERAADLKPRLGAFACLGNHEYSRGVDAVLQAHARSPVRLLRSEGLALDAGGARLWLAGADDPWSMARDNSRFLAQTVQAATRGSAPGDFRVLLSHRPEALPFAARHGVHLTLAGHTHGGQVGLGGRSFWRLLMPDRFLWGTYRQEAAQMYLSAGVGHWFPFRLGCPPEAPIIELRGTNGSPS